MKTLLEKIRKYNTWEGVPFNIGFERSAYLEQIVSYIGNKLIKVIVGQRRTGKSYIMRQVMNFLMSEHAVNPKNIFYINKEYIAFDDISTMKNLEELFEYYKLHFNIVGKVYIFIDEIQNIRNWEKFVNSYSQDFTFDYELFITGSNSNLLSGELATLLSGRYIEFEILPFSLKEFADYKNKEITKNLFIHYLKEGGLPELLNFNNEEIKRHYVDDLRNTIVLRDIVQRNQLKDLTLLEDIFKFIMSNIGNLTSVNGIVKYFKSKQKKTNYDTLSTYVGYLLDTFIVHEVERFNIRGKQILGGVKKYYLNDLAFKNFTLGYYPSDIGYNLENYVYLQLKRMGYKVNIGILNEKEIDFIAEKSDKIMYVQVAYLLNNQKTIDREFGNLLSIKDNHEKIVISMDDIKFSNYEGIKHIHPWELGL